MSICLPNNKIIVKKMPKDAGEEMIKIIKKQQAEVERVRLQAEVDRLQKLANEFLKKLKFTMCIPQMVASNYKLILPYFTNRELLYIKEMLHDVKFKLATWTTHEEFYGRKSHFFTASSASSVERFYGSYPAQKENTTSKHIENIWNITYFLYKNDALRELCEEQLILQVPDHVKEMLTSVANLCSILIAKMKMSPSEATEKEVELTKKFLTSDDLGNQIFNLTQKFKPKLYQNAVDVQDGWRNINALKKDKATLRKYCRRSMKRTCKDTDAKMTWDWKLSERKLEKMLTIIKDIDNQLAEVKVSNLKEEKELKEKMYKIEQQLAVVVGKYDHDMRARQRLFDKIGKQFDKEMKAIRKLQKKFKKQEKTYVVLMKEKAEYEQKIWDARLLALQRNIAAGKIQRYYRYYQSVLKAHRKGKQKKKKK